MKISQRRCTNFVVSSFLTTLIVLGANGCGGAALTPMQEEKLLSFGIVDIQANIDNIKKAREVDNLDFYSYKNFVEAEDAAYEALKMNNSGQDKIEVHNRVEQSKIALAKAYNSKQIIDKELANVLMYKKRLDDLHAQNLFPDAYSDISENITQMTHDIDDGEGIEAFEPRDETLIMVQTLYSKIKVSSNLHNVEAIMNSIDSSIAPKSYQKAQEKLKSAKFTINKFPDDEKMIEEVSKEALSEALYAQAIAKEVNKLTNTEEHIELYVTNEHEKLIEIYKTLASDESNFRSLAYNSKVSTLRDTIEQKSVALESLTAQNALLTKSKEQNQQSLKELSEKLDENREERRVLTSKIELLNADLLKTKDGTLDVNSKLLQAQNSTNELEKSLQELKNSNTNYAEELATLTGELTKTKAELTRLKKDKQRLQTSLKSTKNSLKKEQAGAEKLKSELSKKSAEIAEVKAEADVAQESLKEQTPTK